MKRLYSIHDFKYYTLLKSILYDLELTNKPYWWLISDIEAYPTKEKYINLINNNKFLSFRLYHKKKSRAIVFHFKDNN